MECGKYSLYHAHLTAINVESAESVPIKFTKITLAGNMPTECRVDSYTKTHYPGLLISPVSTHGEFIARGLARCVRSNQRGGCGSQAGYSRTTPTGLILQSDELIVMMVPQRIKNGGGTASV